MATAKKKPAAKAKPQAQEKTDQEQHEEVQRQQTPSETTPDQAQEAKPTETAPDKEQEAQSTENEPSQRLNLRADVRRSASEQVSQELRRQAELEEERRRHNARTGGGEIKEAEVLVAQAEHFDRTDKDARAAFLGQFEKFN